MADPRMEIDDLLAPVNGLAPSRRPTTSIAGTFLPAIPLDWLLAAVVLPGAALPLALAIWLEYRLHGSPEWFLVRARWRKAFGVSRHAERRALDHLVSAGLIRVRRRRGARPRVTVVTRLLR